MVQHFIPSFVWLNCSWTRPQNKHGLHTKSKGVGFVAIQCNTGDDTMGFPCATRMSMMWNIGSRSRGSHSLVAIVYASIIALNIAPVLLVLCSCLRAIISSLWFPSENNEFWKKQAARNILRESEGPGDTNLYATKLWGMLIFINSAPSVSS